MKKLLIIFIILSPISILASVNVEPSRLIVDKKMEIQAGSYTYFNLPLLAGTNLVAKFTVSGGFNNRLNVLLLDLNNYQLFQAGRQFSYYKGTSGSVQNFAQYTFTIPKTNSYYLIFDNRGALMLSRRVHANVYLIEQELGKAQEEDLKLYTALYDGFIRKIFEFEDINVNIRLCGFENAFSNPDITMCRELIDSNNKHGIPGASVFAFFHETAHSLLKLWGYPLWDNEDAADEMATVLVLLIKKESIALQAAQWWATTGSKQEALNKMFVDDRHTISPQRARNIIKWLNNKDELLRRWQKIWIPHMTDEALASLLKSNDSWVDKQLIEETIARSKTSESIGNKEPE